MPQEWPACGALRFMLTDDLAEISVEDFFFLISASLIQIQRMEST